jgi:hypothetical protein
MELTQYAMGALVKGHKLDLIEFKPPALAANVSFGAPAIWRAGRRGASGGGAEAFPPPRV